MSDEEVTFRPPTGTACCVCTAAGHFCPADRYARTKDPDCDLGICEPCATHKDCPTSVARRGEVTDDMAAFIIPAESEPAPMRVIPPEEWDQADAVKQSTTEMEDVTQKDRQGRVYAKDKMREAGREMPVPAKPRPQLYPREKSNKVEERDRAIELLKSGKSVREISSLVNLSHMTVTKIREGLGLDPLPKLGRPKSGDKSHEGNAHKRSQHDRATEMLKSGYPVKVVAQRTNLYSKTVQRIFDEMNKPIEVPMNYVNSSGEEVDMDSRSVTTVTIPVLEAPTATVSGKRQHPAGFKPLLTEGAYVEVMHDIDDKLATARRLVADLENLQANLRKFQGEE